MCQVSLYVFTQRGFIELLLYARCRRQISEQKQKSLPSFQRGEIKNINKEKYRVYWKKIMAKKKNKARRGNEARGRLKCSIRWPGVLVC